MDNSRIEEIKHHLQNFLKESEKNEQLYSIALFDILGFSDFVLNNKTQVVLELYNKLSDLASKLQTRIGESILFAGSVAPIPISKDWKIARLFYNTNGYINVCHFSDTFIIYVSYTMGKSPECLLDTKYDEYPLLFWKDKRYIYDELFETNHHIYLSFLTLCMEFFCQSIIAGIPLRGCISTGKAMMNKSKSLFIGEPLVEAAKAETAQNAVGFAFGSSFNAFHPVYNDYFIPYLGHIKNNKNSRFLSPFVPDWPRYWRESPDYNELDLSEHIMRMCNDSEHNDYYMLATDFVKFSNKNSKWSLEIDRQDIKDMNDYYDRVKKWLKTKSELNNK